MLIDAAHRASRALGEPVASARVDASVLLTFALVAARAHEPGARDAQAALRALGRLDLCAAGDLAAALAGATSASTRLDEAALEALFEATRPLDPGDLGAMSTLHERLLARLCPRGRDEAGVFATPLPVAGLLARTASSLAGDLLPAATLVDPAAGAGLFALAALSQGQRPARLCCVEASPGPSLLSAALLSRATRGARMCVDLHIGDALGDRSRWAPHDGPLVLLANPPFDRLSARSLGERRTSLLAPFVATAGVHRKNLYNLAAAFVGALVELLDADPSRPVIAGLVLPSSMATAEAFAGLRAALADRFDELLWVDLGGDRKGARRSDNVFSAAVPVGLLFASRRGRGRGAAARVAAIDGALVDKLLRCDELSTALSLPAQRNADARGASFAPAPRAAYRHLVALTDLLPWQLGGAQLKRRWPVAPTPSVLLDRWRALLASDRRAAPFRETRDRTVAGRYLDIDGVTRLPSLSSLPEGAPPPPIVRYGYRSFDRQHLLLDGRLGDFLRPSLWRVAGPRQLFMTSQLTRPLGEGAAASLSAHPPDLDHFCNRGGRDVLPLYRDALGREPNVNAEAWRIVHMSAQIDDGPEALFFYAYALLCAPSYTLRFGADHASPGPRLPLSLDRSVLLRGASLGRRLAALHTFGERVGPLAPGPAAPRLRAPEGPRPMPPRALVDGARGVVSLGDVRVEGLSPAAAAFRVGGMPVLASWLGYRTGEGGRRTSPLDAIMPREVGDDVARELRDLCISLHETALLAGELDALLSDALSAPCLAAADLPRPAAHERGPANNPRDGGAPLR